jgi:hypothetical protein
LIRTGVRADDPRLGLSATLAAYIPDCPVDGFQRTLPSLGFDPASISLQPPCEIRGRIVWAIIVFLGQNFSHRPEFIDAPANIG